VNEKQFLTIKRIAGNKEIEYPSLGKAITIF
jgi:hypothetical protein